MLWAPERAKAYNLAFTSCPRSKKVGHPVLGESYGHQCKLVESVNYYLTVPLSIIKGDYI